MLIKKLAIDIELGVTGSHRHMRVARDSHKILVRGPHWRSSFEEVCLTEKLFSNTSCGLALIAAKRKALDVRLFRCSSNCYKLNEESSDSRDLNSNDTTEHQKLPIWTNEGQ